MISIQIFLLVIGASIFHAVWNFFARKVKGNMGVVWLGFLFGSLIVAPLAIYFLVHDIQSHINLKLAFIYAVLSGKLFRSLNLPKTGLIHTFYLIALALAYKEGDISLVYPIARGSGVAGTALISGLGLKEKISILGWIGISSVVAGIFLLGMGNFIFLTKKVYKC